MKQNGIFTCLYLQLIILMLLLCAAASLCHTCMWYVGFAGEENLI